MWILAYHQRVPLSHNVDLPAKDVMQDANNTAPNASGILCIPERGQAERAGRVHLRASEEV